MRKSWGLTGVFLGAVVLAGCASFPEPGGSRLGESEAWTGITGDAANTSSTTADAQSDARLTWSRSLAAPLAGPAASDGHGMVYQATTSEEGCNLFGMSVEDGRKNWCSRLSTSGHRITPTVDARGNSYLPMGEGVASISNEGEYRWTGTTEGTPVSLTLLDERLLLSITQFGAAQIFNTQTGAEVSAPFRLSDPVSDVEPDWGIPWCATGDRGCPVAGPAAVDLEERQVFTTVWPSGSDTPELVAVHVSEGPERRDDDVRESPVITELWSAPLVADRGPAPVVLDAERGRLLVTGADGSLDAYATENGGHLWSVDLGFAPDFSPALLPDGTVVSAGRTATAWRGPDDPHEPDAGPAPVVAVSPTDDGAAETWRRSDLQQLANPVATADGRVAVAVRDGENGIAVHVLDGETGEDVEVYDVPGAEGPVSGLSADDDGNLSLSVSAGRIYLVGDIGE